MIDCLYDCFKHWSETGTVYVYSDTHFNDNDLANVFNRPSADEQVKLINSKCGKADTLILLGDVGDISYIKKLKAKRKILICGNHDSGASNYIRKNISVGKFNVKNYTKQEVLDRVYEAFPKTEYKINIEFISKYYGDIFYNVTVDNCLFDEVYSGPLIISDKIILSHEPLNNIDWAFNIHGHDHNSRRKNDNYHYNVCSDANNYQMLNLNQFVKSGALGKVKSIHRETIDNATKRKYNRNKEKTNK